MVAVDDGFCVVEEDVDELTALPAVDALDELVRKLVVRQSHQRLDAVLHAAVEFQAYLDSMVTRVAERAAQAIGLTAEDAWTLVAHLLNYAMGLWPIVARRHGYGDKAQQAFLARYAQFAALLLG